MNFKFRNLLMTAGALLAFTACSSDEDPIGIEPEAQLSDFAVNIAIPSNKASTRTIDDPVKSMTPIVDKVHVYVKNSEGTIERQGEADKEGDTGQWSAEFKSVPVKGTETVVIVAYNEAEQNKSDLMIDIMDVQPGADTKSQLSNAAYALDIPLIASTTEGKKVTITDGADRKLYTIDAKLNSIVARTEFSKAINFNPELVVSADLGVVSPMKYTKTYGQADLQNPTAAGDNLFFELDATALDQMEAGKVVAHHIFDGDEQSFNIALNVVNYECTTNKKTGAYKTAIVDKDAENKDVLSFIYQDVDGNEAAKKGETYLKVDKDGEGNYYVLLDNDNNQVSYESFKRATYTDTRWFALGGFVATEDEQKVNEGKYVGGHIYKLNLNTGLTWKGDNPGWYSPDEDKGTDEPQVTQNVDILANVEIAEWTEGEYTAPVL